MSVSKSGASVVCLDETRKQLVREKRPGFTHGQGVEHVDYEYEQAGVATLYMLTEPLAGFREVRVETCQDRFAWARTVAQLVEECFPAAERITLIQDNLSAHTTAALYELFTPERARAILRKLEIVFTPVHGSWFNIAEIELSVLTRQVLAHRIPESSTLQQVVQDWYRGRNTKQRGVEWHFTTTDARLKLERLYPSIIA
jgi:hypothetical protein